MMYDSTAEVEAFFYKLLAHILAHMFGCVYACFSFLLKTFKCDSLKGDIL